MKPLKIAQIGVANYGAYRRARLRESGLFELVGVYDWNTQALDTLTREEGVPSCQSLDTLLDLPALEAVFVCSGAKFHAEQILAALKRGLHVFVEKPLCATPQEMGWLLEAQRKSGLVVGVGHDNCATSAAPKKIKNLLDSGELGSIAAFEKTTAHNGGLHLKDGDWRGDTAKNPGGMLFQCGVHALHELMFYFGAPSHISAVMRSNVHSSGTTDVALCHLRWPSGLIGTLNAYHVTPYRHSFALFGTKANLYREEDPCFPERVRLWQQTTHLDNAPEPKIRLPIDEQDDPCGNIRSFYRAIRENSVAYPSLLDGARAVALVFAAQEAAEMGTTIDVRARFPEVFSDL